MKIYSSQPCACLSHSCMLLLADGAQLIGSQPLQRSVEWVVDEPFKRLVVSERQQASGMLSVELAGAAAAGTVGAPWS
jgi:hypothetical protein